MAALMIFTKHSLCKNPIFLNKIKRSVTLYKTNSRFIPQCSNFNKIHARVCLTTKLSYINKNITSKKKYILTEVTILISELISCFLSKLVSNKKKFN